MSAQRRTKKPTSRAPRRRAKPVRDFWGSDHPTDRVPTPIRAVEHPTALIQSLGAPPFPRAAVARHYFDSVYERAAALAIALAASAGLSENDDLTDALVADDADPSAASAIS
jgi:hypothetical protein